VFARLLTFPNVIIAGHQAFFKREALENIAATTIENIARFEQVKHSAITGTVPPSRPGVLWT
jgi:D-lactate dehydrogenase